MAINLGVRDLGIAQHFTVAGDEAEIRLEKGKNDIGERDPYNLNEHLRVQFDEVFGEPHPGVFSFDNIWLTSYSVFATTKLWIYRILSLICTLPLMVFWGCIFACISFWTIWCCQPTLRVWELIMHCFKTFWSTIVNTYYGPCMEATGLLCSRIKIRFEKTSDAV